MELAAHSVGTSATHPYTCLSCSLAFVDAASQREHYATELHRYNSRRRVAGLAAVTQELFEDKISQASTALAPKADDDAPKKLACKACNKTFASAATHQAHLNTKKHKEAVFKAASKVQVGDLGAKPTPAPEDTSMAPPVPSTSTAPPPPAPAAAVAVASAEIPFESSGDAALDRVVAKRLLYAPPIPVTSCLFCPHASSSVQDNVAHMRHAHSFVIPEEEYLVDLEGLLRRLGEEVGTWNVCVCCGKGYGGNIDLGKEDEGHSKEELAKRASKGVEAVRAHMQSKSHCRLKYDTEDQQLEIADFYDFRPSYPDYQERLDRKAAKKAAKAAKQAAEGWEDEEMPEGEDLEGDENVEVVYESASDSDDSDSDDDDLPTDSGITYGDTEYELVLPSGARIGHRTHRHVHKQNLLPYLSGSPFKPAPHNSQAEIKPSPHSQALLSLVPMIKKDRTHARPLHTAALVPAKGAGFGKGGEVIKARNKGEAKEAGKATREFKELRHWNKQANIRGEKGNNQKHFRDFLLQ
ncbi:hypothetical protein JCM1841_000038 [Sporobolomyces salmonicolor]